MSDGHAHAGDQNTLVSIVVSSFNYAQYLPQAIDSALAQTHPATEVIVVDDGSTDGSHAVIAGYGDRVRAVFKDNGGQASAFNAGFRASRGEVVIFLDSDDTLTSAAAAHAARLFAQHPDAAKVHWPLRVIDGAGAMAGRTVPAAPLAEGDLRDLVLAKGPGEYGWPPTSGNAWSRRFFEAVLPMPEAEFRTCPDLYLSALVPLYGPILRVAEPQGCWRVHGTNNSWRSPFDVTLRETIKRCDHCFDAVERWASAHGVRADRESWKATSWWHRVWRTTQEIIAAVPADATLVLADEDQWAADDRIGSIKRLPFTERAGAYGGPPADDDAAVREMQRLRSGGAAFAAFVWPAFWWLEHYAGLNRYLQSFPVVLRNERLVLFDMHP